MLAPLVARLLDLLPFPLRLRAALLGRQRQEPTGARPPLLYLLKDLVEGFVDVVDPVAGYGEDVAIEANVEDELLLELAVLAVVRVPDNEAILVFEPDLLTLNERVEEGAHLLPRSKSRYALPEHLQVSRGDLLDRGAQLRLDVESNLPGERRPYVAHREKNEVVAHIEVSDDEWPRLILPEPPRLPDLSGRNEGGDAQQDELQTHEYDLGYVCPRRLSHVAILPSTPDACAPSARPPSVDGNVTVECSNCGSDVATAIAVASLIVAAVSLVLAALARRDSKRSAEASATSAEIAREQRDMMREEHEVWLEQVHARSDLELTMKTAGADDDGILRTEGSGVFIRVEVGIANRGSRAAGPTVLNVLAPRHTRHLRWSGPLGEEIDRPLVAQTPETLTSPDGAVREADFLSQRLETVRRASPEVRFVSFSVDFPQPLQEGDEVVVPLRAKASADEQPEDASEVSVDHLVRVRREPPLR